MMRFIFPYSWHTAMLLFGSDSAVIRTERAYMRLVVTLQALLGYILNSRVSYMVGGSKISKSNQD